jgi:hypothetical protein
VAWQAVVTVVSWIVTTIESIVGWILSALAWVIGLVFSIPILGRLIRWLWDIVLTVVWGIVSLGDGLLGLLGWLPEKRLRICVIMLRQPGDNGALATAITSCVASIQNTIDILWDQANVRVVPVAPFSYVPMFGDKETATADWIHTHPSDGSAPDFALDADCNLPAGGDDLWLPGAYYEFVANNTCVFQDWRNVTGYGAPIAVFVVRQFSGAFGGCSLGPLNDWVTVDRPSIIDMAHEIGHACNLWHVGDQDNLMNPDINGTKLHRWQVVLLRMSRHVTYL